MIHLPGNLDALPDLSLYPSRVENNSAVRNAFDALSTPLTTGLLTLGNDLYQSRTRGGLVSLCNTLFRLRSLKSVVQLRTDASANNFLKVRGVEVSLRSLEFDAIDDIDSKLNELELEGVTWITYGSWTDVCPPGDKTAVSAGWVIFGVWPKPLKRNYPGNLR